MISKPTVFRTLAFLLLLAVPAAIQAGQEVADSDCLDCHDIQVESMDIGHILSGDSRQAAVHCTNCHTGASAHVDDPSAETITKPTELTPIEEGKLCTTCHKPHQSVDDFDIDAHLSQGIRCTSCHSIHSGKQTDLINGVICMNCHQSVKASFGLRSSHPIKSGNVTCMSCHKSVKRFDDNIAYEANRVCRDCHQDYDHFAIYRHGGSDASVATSGGCVECHDPHGSAHDHLLKLPVNSLCSSCHFQPIHQTAHPPFHVDRYSCIYCHSEIHGSSESNLFLDPDLPSKIGVDCFQSGCHALVK